MQYPSTIRSTLPLASLLLALALGCSVFTGCASQRESHVWHKWVMEADRYYDFELYEEANDLYSRLHDTAPSASMQRYVRFKLAQIEAYTGSLELAYAMLDALEAEPNYDDDEWTSRAHFERALWKLEFEDDLDGSIEICEEVIVLYPNSSIAPRALEQIVDYMRERGWLRELVDWFEMLYPEYKVTELGDDFIYRSAKFYLFDFEELETAEMLFLQMIDAYEFSPFRDDSLYHLGTIAQTQLRYEDALIYYERLAEVHDEAWRLGQYDSTLRDDSMRRRAEIFLAMDEPYLALAEYERILDAFPDMLGGATLALEAIDLYRTPIGDREAYAQALAELIETYPESVRAEEAARRLELVLDGAELLDIPELSKELRRERRKAGAREQ